MTETPPSPHNPGDEIGRLSPDRLMHGFGRSRLAFFLAVAILAHVVVLGATSVKTIHKWIDPAYAEMLRKEEELGRKVAAARKAPARPAASKPASKPATAKAGELDLLNKKSSVVRDATSLPKDKKDIPTKPDLGIGIDETNKPKRP